MANANICEINQQVIESVSDISHRIVKNVLETKQSIIVNDVENDTLYNRDAELNDYLAKSILCTPILSKGEVIAIIYLDNLIL